MGFIMLTIIFICMGFGYHAMLATPAGTKAFVFLYCMANFFQVTNPRLLLVPFLTLELWAKHYYLCYPGRGVPHAISIDRPRYLCGFWKARRHYRP
jgi:hypothetical protein